MQLLYKDLRDLKDTQVHKGSKDPKDCRVHRELKVIQDHKD